MEKALVMMEFFLNKEFFLLIVLSGIIFSAREEKREKFFLRLMVGIVLGLIFDKVIGLPVEKTLEFESVGVAIISFEILRAFFQFFISAVILYCSYQYKITNALYIAVLGYAIEHMTVLLSHGLCYYFWSDCDWIEAYVYLGLFVVMYLAEFLFVKKYEINASNMDNQSLIAQSAIFLSGAIILSVFSYYYVVKRADLKGTPIVFIVTSFGILICGNVVIGLLDILKISSVKQELIRTRQLWQEDVKQYKLSRETTETLNMRYHDLKSRMEILLEDPTAVDEIRKTIDEYDRSVRTGNEAMDVVLTEKMLLCQRSNINLTVMADGDCLRQMSPVETYTVLGNLLDNAMEYLEQIDDKEKRVILLSVKQEGDMDVVIIENYLKDKLKWKEQLPVSTKTDKNFHGYGLKSVRHTLNKNGGHLRVSTEHQLFCVTVVLPR